MKKNLIKWLGGTVAVLAVTSMAHATTSEAIRFSIDNGANWSTFNGVDDSGGMTAMFSGVNGTFTVSISTGTGINPPINSNPGMPEIDFDVSGFLSSSGLPNGSLIVEYSVAGLTPVPTGSFVNAINPVGPSKPGAYSETETTRIGSGLFGTGTTFASIGGNSWAGPYTGSNVVPSGITDGYSITLQDVFTLNVDPSTGIGRATISDDGSLTTVPDGGSTMMLLGSALSAVGLMKFRFRKAAVKA